MQYGCTQYGEVEYLVTRSTEVKLAWGTPFRATNHVNNCTLNVDIASEGVDPGRVARYVLFHKVEHEKHETTRESQDDIHYTSHFPELRLIKFGHKSDTETANACHCHDRKVNRSVDKNLLTCHRVVQDRNA